jgi:hypothetical protein
MSTEPVTKIRDELFGEVAGQFERDEPPMTLQWIQDRSVTHEELTALRQGIALILRGYQSLRPDERIAFVTRGVLTTRPIDPPAPKPDQPDRKLS